jgi:phosphoglucosamine mutase
VLLTGPLPTPGIAYLTRAPLAAGVVISASHNPYYDNGIKFFSASGDKLPDDVESQIEAMVEEPMTCVHSDELGRAAASTTLPVATSSSARARSRTSMTCMV